MTADCFFLLLARRCSLGRRPMLDSVSERVSMLAAEIY
jgi:hypothetical protein